MTTALLSLLLVLAVLNAALLVIVYFRSSRGGDADRLLREELREGRAEASQAARESREELSLSLKSANDTLSVTLGNLGELQRTQLDGLTKQLKDLSDSNTASLDRIRTTMAERVKMLQDGNEKKLDEMRKTVDEKLHDTLEKRLGESFKLVSDRLEAVHRGLGEMQNLATGVGDLKRVLTNVKARGTWAEVQLGALLEQILTPAQFARNVQTKEDSRELVEFAIRLPGPKDDPDCCVWLPIDSKFPTEDYARLQDAAERGEVDAVQKAVDALARSIKVQAELISSKYICPPATTDFAIMFLPTEGLYAEVLRHPSLADELQHKYHVVVAGPMTLAAILNSFRMGFQTLAIEQQSAEVWKVLAAVKTEFGKFGSVLDKVKKQLNTAARTIDETGVRSRAMERRLRSIESLPEADAVDILELPAAFEPTPLDAADLLSTAEDMAP
ncbi:MAG: DNA recombination protein RmuC [Coriobacteriales bacterium]|nr:DNA recombination protein RmuC [Coriobacteriales bacterium]